MQANNLIKHESFNFIRIVVFGNIQKTLYRLVYNSLIVKCYFF